jgi:hypothetical protein
VTITNNQQEAALFTAGDNASSVTAVEISTSSTANIVTQSMLANSVIDDTVDLTDDSNDKSALPSKRRQYEKMMHEYLKVLYTEPFKYPYRASYCRG